MKERVKVVKDFNNSLLNLQILIIMYTVSTQDVNLDKYCCRVLVAA